MSDTTYFARAARIYIYYQRSRRNLTHTALLNLMEQADHDASEASSQFSTPENGRTSVFSRKRMGKYAKDGYIFIAAFCIFSFLFMIEVVTAIVEGGLQDMTSDDCPRLSLTEGLHLGISGLFEFLCHKNMVRIFERDIGLSIEVVGRRDI